MAVGLVCGARNTIKKDDATGSHLVFHDDCRHIRERVVMFAFLRGTVALKGLDHIALDVGGAGYRVLAPERIRSKLVVNQEVTLLTYCHIRENTFNYFR